MPEPSSVSKRELHRLHAAITFVQGGDEVARRHGLDPRTWRVLVAVALQDRDALTAVGLLPPNARRALNALTAKGLVEQQPDPSDRRRKVPAPTQAGWLVLRELADAA